MTAALAMVVAASAQQPSVKVNVINVCAPSADEQKELSSALAKVPGKAALSKGYEVSRGHSTLDPSIPIPGMEPLPPGVDSAADWVRIRREFPDATLFSNVQYSFSVDAKNMVETLVLRVRDPKDLMQISIEDSASAVASATAMLSTTTPVSRVKLERFGKASVALARCSGAERTPATGQSTYEPTFRAASSSRERRRDLRGASTKGSQGLPRLGSRAAPTQGGGKKKA